MKTPQSKDLKLSSKKEKMSRPEGQFSFKPKKIEVKGLKIKAKSKKPIKKIGKKSVGYGMLDSAMQKIASKK